jgi:hypothetical protein
LLYQLSYGGLGIALGRAAMLVAWRGRAVNLARGARLVVVVVLGD